MTCPGPLARSMHADDALEPAARSAMEQHLAACPGCRQRIDGLRAGRLALRAVLRREDAATVPAFVPPARNVPLAISAVLALAVAGAASAFWQGLLAAAPSGMRWLNPFSSGELLESGLGIVSFLIREGSTMLSSILNIVGTALFAALGAWGLMTLGRRRAGTIALLAIVAATIALPRPAAAIEVRRTDNGLVTLPAGEVIQDTLIAAGETVVIDGDVDGDLFALGRAVTVRGKVAGNLITGAETITVEGTIGGSILAAGRGINLSTAQVARNLYGFGRDIETGQSSSVSGNALTFGDVIEIAGRVGIDTHSFGKRVMISGNVARNVAAYAERVELLPSARVGGNLSTRTASADDVQIAPGAVIGGTIEHHDVDRKQRRNRYATVGFYFGKVVQLGAAFVAGLLLLWLFPALRSLSLDGAVAALTSAGIGLATAVTLPIAALLACLTIIGLPIGIAAFVVGALGLYLAKVVIAQLIGRRLLGNAHHAVALLAGLAVLLIAGSVPFIGPVISFVVTITGFGMMARALFQRLSAGSAA